MAGFLAVGGLLPARPASAAQAPAASAPAIADSVTKAYAANRRPPVHQLPGHRHGDRRIIELPEVRAAKSLANQMHVQADELMEAAGKRLAELTGAEWGMVSAGCSAAISHATAACVAGGNPDLHVRIPDLSGFKKDEAIIPVHSRTVYDAAIRAVGVKIIEVDSLEALEHAIGPRTALIYIRPNAENEKGPMPTDAIAKIAKPHNVPVLVDAAAEALTIPSVHLQWGATLVCYSGGKIIRGPAERGPAARPEGPGPGRVGAQRAASRLRAQYEGGARRGDGHARRRGELGQARPRGGVEGVGRPLRLHCQPRHDDSGRDRIGAARSGPPQQPQRAAVAAVECESAGHHGRRCRRSILDTTDPRILLGGGGGGAGSRTRAGDTGLSISTGLFTPGDEKIVAERRVSGVVREAHAQGGGPLKPPAGDVSGSWKVDIQFAASRSVHTLDLVQQGNRLKGTHQGDFTAREVSGTIDAAAVTFDTSAAEFHGDSLSTRSRAR